MNTPNKAILAVFNLGGAEIILILGSLFLLAVVAAGVFGLIYLIIRAVVNRPPPPPLTLPPDVANQTQRRRDLGHIKLLAVFHFVFAGLALVGIGVLGVHYAFMHMIFSNPDIWKGQPPQSPPPKAFFEVFIWFYLFAGVLMLTGLVLNLLSGLFLLQKRNRLFSLIVAGLNCLQIPFGTALGIFTILVLSRESACQLYVGGNSLDERETEIRH